MKDIILISATRERSVRCPQKMYRKFGNTTLTDILLNKLENIQDSTDVFDEVIFAVYPGDTHIWQKAISHNVKIEERDGFSARHGKLLSDIHHYLDRYNQKYVMWINGCLPFLKEKTIIDAAELFVECNDIEGMHPVKRRYNWFWQDWTPVNILDKKYTRTQDAGEIYESVHAFHIFNREYMLMNDAYWDIKVNNPYLYVVEDSLEFFDINTEMDFIIGEKLYESKDNWCR